MKQLFQCMPCRQTLSVSRRYSDSPRNELASADDRPVVLKVPSIRASRLPLTVDRSAQGWSTGASPYPELAPSSISQFRHPVVRSSSNNFRTAHNTRVRPRPSSAEATHHNHGRATRTPWYPRGPLWLGYLPCYLSGEVRIPEKSTQRCKTRKY